MSAQAKQLAWPESVLGHDDEVGEETGRGLHHSNLAVRHRNQSINKPNHQFLSTVDRF